MNTYRMTCHQTSTYDFYIDADNEEAAYEQLWEIVGFEGEDIDMHDPYTWDFDVECRIEIERAG